MAKKRVCMTCGKEYVYCPQCDSKTVRDAWRINWCSEECRDVFDALSAYAMGTCTDKEVKAVLEKYGVKNCEKYKPSINEQLKKIVYVPAKLEEVKEAEPKKASAFTKKQAD